MDDASVDIVTSLTHVLDEMRETTSLLPVAELSRSTDRPWWRNIFFAFARSKAEVGAGLAVQYLSENLDRARAHWREGVRLFAELQQAHRADETLMVLTGQISDKGFDEVASRLEDESVPRPVGRAAAHLADVVATIRDCDSIIVAARGKMLLQRMRKE